MKRLHRHEVLLLIGGVAVAVFLGLNLLVLRPLSRNVRQLRVETQDKAARLRATGWPLEPRSLETLAITKQNELSNVQRRKSQVLTAAMSLFQQRISRLYGTPTHFQEHVTRLDYQEEYHRIERKLADLGIPLDRGTLGIGEDSVRPNIYELVLQLYALEAAVDLLFEHQLEPVAADPDDDTGGGGAALALGEPVRYHLSNDHPDPYLLEFPVRIRLRGSLEQLQSFLLAAGAGDRFLAVTRLEVYNPVPALRRGETHEVTAEIECTAFYLLDGDIRAEAAARPAERILPRGA